MRRRARPMTRVKPAGADSRRDIGLQGAAPTLTPVVARSVRGPRRCGYTADRVELETPVTNPSSNDNRRRWAPEWIAVLTLAVAILALGGGIFASLHAMETRIREDMRAMESGIRTDMQAMEHRIREDVRELRGDVGMLRERVSSLEERVSGLDRRVSDLDRRVSGLDRRVSRLEARFDEQFPPRSATAPSSANGRTSPARQMGL